MSEQMTAADLAIDISDGALCRDLSCLECKRERDRREALILEDRKATVERCKEAADSVITSNFSIAKLHREELNSALDAVLEETE